MIHDAQVEVTCDADGCCESIYIQLDYVYQSLAGGGGHYDHRDKSINRKVLLEEWEIDANGGHFCPEHAEQAREGDT